MHRVPEETAELDIEERWSRLMTAAQDGDQVAYDRLLREIVPFIKAFVRLQHRSEDRVEETVQDVLLTLHRVRHTYDPSRPFKPWLSTIARRRSIDLLRRRSRWSLFEITDNRTYEAFPDPAANKAEDVYSRTEGLSKAIAGLPQQQREAVELLKLKALSLAEASKASGRSVAALKINMHRAIKSLRARWAGRTLTD